MYITLHHSAPGVFYWDKKNLDVPTGRVTDGRMWFIIQLPRLDVRSVFFLRIPVSPHLSVLSCSFGINEVPQEGVIVVSQPEKCQSSVILQSVKINKQRRASVYKFAPISHFNSFGPFWAKAPELYQLITDSAVSTRQFKGSVTKIQHLLTLVNLGYDISRPL